ncbi:hypothetical protein D9M68_888270 [compost metagenome]
MVDLNKSSIPSKCSRDRSMRMGAACLAARRKVCGGMLFGVSGFLGGVLLALQFGVDEGLHANGVAMPAGQLPRKEAALAGTVKETFARQWPPGPLFLAAEEGRQEALAPRWVF